VLVKQQQCFIWTSSVAVVPLLNSKFLSFSPHGFPLHLRGGARYKLQRESVNSELAESLTGCILAHATSAAGKNDDQGGAASSMK
jgi:hypothetical protein